MKNLLSTAAIENANVNTVNTVANESKSWAKELAEEAAKRQDPYIWDEYKCGKLPKDAFAQVTYLPLKKCVQMINSCLVEKAKNEEICAPVLLEELASLGYDKFSLNLVQFFWSKNAIVCGLADDTESSDFTIVKAKMDESGRPCYRPGDIVRSFEHRFGLIASTFEKAVSLYGPTGSKAVYLKEKEIEKAAKKAEKEAAKAERMAQKAAKQLAKGEAKAATLALASQMVENALGRPATEEEIKAMACTLKKLGA